jgi:hypothetical protein
MNMKKCILGLCIFCFCAVGLFAQPGDRANVKIEAQKVAYITNRLDFNAQESAEFWPVYNQLQKDRKEIIRKYKSKQRIENMTDAELEKQMMSSFKKDQELLGLEKIYFEKLKKVLSIRKIATLHVAEREFKYFRYDERATKRKTKAT